MTRVFVGFTVDIDPESYGKVFKVKSENAGQDMKRRVVDEFVEMLADQGIDCEIVMVSP